MRVLFIALGDARRTAVVSEASEVLRNNGTATVLVGDVSRWKNEVLPDGVDLVAITQLERDHLPLRVERGVVFGAPRRLIMLVGRGPLRQRAKRVWKSYERRVAKPVHRRAMRRYSQVWGDRRERIVTDFAMVGRFDYISVMDYLSIHAGAQVMTARVASAGSDVRIGFGIDYLR